MGASIDTYLKELSYKFYLKNDGNEIIRIKQSINSLFTNLNKEPGLLIKRKFVFGSYDRDTILPRRIDSNSDVDVMVVFDTTQYKRTPETYRNWLKSFADKYYKNRYGSDVIKSYPTVTIRLENIHYDLVPAKEESSFYQETLYIPDKNSIYGWQQTNPDDVKQKLIQCNTQYNSIVRPIIRLLKAWNCKNDYPFDSYKLELSITNMNFYGDDIQRGFFYAVDQLSLYYEYNLAENKKQKINSLKYNIGKVKEALDRYDKVNARIWLHKVLPEG